MLAPDEILSVLHLLLLSAFIGVASVTMLATLVSHLRVRCTLLTWRRGRFHGLPVGPVLFTVIVSAGLAYAWGRGYVIPPSILIGYPAGGIFWCIAAFLARSVIVTEYGIIQDLNRISQAVAWGQIVDYFVASDEGRERYVFLYMDAEGMRRRRLELEVPEVHVDDFRAIVEAKLDARFAFSRQEPRDKKTLEE